MLELVIAIGVILILFAAVFVIVMPQELNARGRDEKRLSDISTLERAVVEYSMDFGVYPDAADVTRVSTSLPTGSPGPVEKIIDGWISANLSSYIPKLPIDPINDITYYYSYRHTASSFEINAALEYFTEYAENASDGGDDETVYEVGNDLTIL